MLNHEEISHLVKSRTALQSQHILPYSFNNRGRVHTLKVHTVTSALYLNWALYTTVCIATLIRFVLLNALNDVAMCSIFYIPHKHLLQVYPIPYKLIQYCTELYESHCYYDSSSTNS